MTGLIVGLAFTGVLLTLWLVTSEIFREPTCPPLLGIPACYLVLVAYGLATVGGWIATRSSGQESLGYGRIEDMVAGLEVGQSNASPVPLAGMYVGLVVMLLAYLFGAWAMAVNEHFELLAQQDETQMRRKLKLESAELMSVIHLIRSWAGIPSVPASCARP